MFVILNRSATEVKNPVKVFILISCLLDASLALLAQHDESTKYYIL